MPNIEHKRIRAEASEGSSEQCGRQRILNFEGLNHESHEFTRIGRRGILLPEFQLDKEPFYPQMDADFRRWEGGEIQQND